MKGKIKSFNDEKEYGFIIPLGVSKGHDLFFHMRDVWGDCDFCDGDLVDFNMIAVEITKPMKRSLYINNRWVRSWWRTIIIGGIDIEVAAYDKEGIDRVEFYIGKKLKATDTTEPYTWTWDERAFGSRMIEVKAYDNAGNSNTAKIRVLIFNK